MESAGWVIKKSSGEKLGWSDSSDCWKDNRDSIEDTWATKH